MNVIGLVSVAISMVAWVGAMTAWFYTAYHGVIFLIRCWQDTATGQGWGVAKFLSLGPIWFKSDLPEGARLHRQKALMGVAAFVICGIIGFSVELIGIAGH
jgi:hypothetical protein